MGHTAPSRTISLDSCDLQRALLDDGSWPRVAPAWQDVALSPDPNVATADTPHIDEAPGRLHILLKRHSAAHVRGRCCLVAYMATVWVGGLVGTLCLAAFGGYYGAGVALLLLAILGFYGYAVVFITRALLTMTRGAHNVRGSYLTITADEEKYLIRWGPWNTDTTRGRVADLRGAQVCSAAHCVMLSLLDEGDRPCCPALRVLVTTVDARSAVTCILACMIRR